MIQRIQSVWLLVAAVCAFVSLQTSFYIGSIGNAAAEHFTGKTSMIILILTVISGTLSFVNVFLFKNRSLQLKLALADLVLSILVIVLYFYSTAKYTTGGVSIWAGIVFIIPVALLLAVRGIYKDEKLVKSVDRLR